MKTENVKKSGRTSRTKHIGLVRNDSYLEPFEDAIKGRHEHALWKLGCLTRNGKTKLSDFANGHNYYGLHKLKRGWVFREWAPNATRLFLVGDFNKWQENEKYEAHRIEGTGNWELKLKEKDLKHGDLYKMHVYWDGGFGERIPAWTRRVVQDEQTKIFSAQVWNPAEQYVWKKETFRPKKSPLLIYECHIGMAEDAEKVGSYDEFRENVLPRIIADGYNCIQVMAIQEHPYYGSFGYHVSSFFSSSRTWQPSLAFRFDGFRFDGVTSMLYYSHGLGEAFCGYQDYFNGHQDDNAICYLTLANLLIHEVNPQAITIAEEVSGMPGLAAKFADGGYGFDYRMAMNIPDYWIKTIKEQPDENWKPSSIFCIGVVHTCSSIRCPLVGNRSTRDVQTRCP